MGMRRSKKKPGKGGTTKEAQGNGFTSEAPSTSKANK
jgi:hypothetical protein